MQVFLAQVRGVAMMVMKTMMMAMVIRVGGVYGDEDNHDGDGNDNDGDDYDDSNSQVVNGHGVRWR